MNFDKYLDVHFYDEKFSENYPAELEKIVTKLLVLRDNDGNPPSLEVRKQIVETLFDAFIKQTDQQPDGVQVQRLANWILLEDLTDGRPDKVTLTAYPILTKRQLRTRYQRERADEEVPIHATEQKYLGRKKNSFYRSKEN